MYNIDEQCLTKIVREALINEGIFGNDYTYGEKWWNPLSWRSKEEKAKIDKDNNEKARKYRELVTKREQVMQNEIGLTLQDINKLYTKINKLINTPVQQIANNNGCQVSEQIEKESLSWADTSFLPCGRAGYINILGKQFFAQQPIQIYTRNLVSAMNSYLSNGQKTGFLSSRTNEINRQAFKYVIYEKYAYRFKDLKQSYKPFEFVLKLGNKLKSLGY